MCVLTCSIPCLLSCLLAGIPHEGNYSSWLEKKEKRFQEEKKQDARLRRTLASELEWVRSSAKARQTKSKARLTRYEELLATPAREVASSGTIYIPPGPRLGECYPRLICHITANSILDLTAKLGRVNLPVV